MPSSPAKLHPHDDLRVVGDGRFLIGGSPTTVLTLSRAGAATVRRWFSGGPVPTEGTAAALAARLEDRDLAWRDIAGPEPAATGRIVVVIPYYDDPDGLRATLETIGGPEPDAAPERILVVDDASPTPLPALGTAREPEIVRLPLNGGPGAARNAGVERLGDEDDDTVVVFVDAGVTISAAAIGRLATMIDGSKDIVAAAPRIRSSVRAESFLADYERRHSPLDLGSRPASVAPGHRVAYVPSAVLAVRLGALRALGPTPFDPELRYGEDVDLVWRLAALGNVLYRPDIVAEHPPRADGHALIRQRFAYGTAAGPLAARHGDALAPLRIAPWSALAVAALALPGLAAIASSMLAVAGATLAVERRLPEELPARRGEALRLVATGHALTMRGAGMALLRSWGPLLAVALIASGSSRRLALRLLAVGAGRRLRLDDPASSLLEVGVGVVDDLAYDAGVWRGVFESRNERRRARLRALLPVLSR